MIMHTLSSLKGSNVLPESHSLAESFSLITPDFKKRIVSVLSSSSSVYLDKDLSENRVFMDLCLDTISYVCRLKKAPPSYFFESIEDDLLESLTAVLQKSMSDFTEPAIVIALLSTQRTINSLLAKKFIQHKI